MKRSGVMRDALLVALSAAAGAIDAVSYLRFHTFTANMTGNTVLLGLALGGRHLGDAERSVAAIIAFCAGAFLGAALGSEASDDDPWPARQLSAFGLEIVLLAGFAWIAGAAQLGSDGSLGALLLGAGAMGVQSGITHDLHPGSASTTYMSGTVARVGEFLADSLRFGFRGGVVLNAATWVAYLSAAIATGFSDARTHADGELPWIVIAVVAAVAVTARPLLLRAKEPRAA